MMMGADAINAEDQESTSEHETEHNPHSLITDLVKKNRS